MEDITMTGLQMLTSYGALGVCCVYFMFKDWVKAKETDRVIERSTEAIQEFSAAMVLCNRNGAVK